MSLGFEQAGFDIAVAVEIDPIHAATHHFNFPETAVIARSVVGLQPAEIRRFAKIGNRTVDVVFGGAPCQGFSLIGHRILDDPRNQLVSEFIRIVVGLQASYFVFENVKGLTVGGHKQFLNELIEEFSRHDYSLRMPWQVLNAKAYGVPQERERLFLLGARRGLRLPEYPPTVTSGKSNGSQGAAPPTCLEALGDLPDVDDYEELVEGDSIRVRVRRKPSSYARELRCETKGCWHFGHRRSWDSSMLTASMRTGHTGISLRRFAETKPGEVEPISRFFKLAADGQSNTLRAGTDSARGAFTSPRPIHYALPRCVSVREMARLHAYPDWFRFHITKWHGARQIGNSVPPPLARAIATSVIEAVGAKPRRSRRVLTLGDPQLLSMDMSEAAEFWGIAVPIARRDRKSGAKKRKQHEIEAERLAMRRTNGRHEAAEPVLGHH